MRSVPVHEALKTVVLAVALTVSLSPYQQMMAQILPPDPSCFPLDVGYEWSYNGPPGFSHTERILDTAIIRGMVYYGLSIGAPEPREWFRKSDDSVYVIERDTANVEHLLYNFDAHVGDSLTLPPPYFCTYGNRIVLVSTEDTIVTPAGTFLNCYHFTHANLCSDAGIFDSWFAKGIGRVRYLEVSFTGTIDYLLDGYVVTSVRSPRSKPSDLSYRLFQNYPNPFNPATVISYRLPTRSCVTLRVVDILGREAARLVDGEQDPGIHNVSWTASGFPSGVYFATLNARSFSAVRKLVLLK